MKNLLVCLCVWWLGVQIDECAAMDGLEARLYERWLLSTDWIAQVDRSLVFDFCAAWYRDLSAKQLSGTIPDGILSNQLIQLYVELMIAS